MIWKLSLIWGWDLNQKWWHAKSNFSSVWMINSLLRMHTRLTAVLKALIGVASIKLAAKPYRNGEGTFSVFSSVGFWPCYIYDLFPFCVSTRLIAAWISCSILLTRKDVGNWWLSEPCLNWNWWLTFFFLCKNEITRTNLTRFPVYNFR